MFLDASAVVAILAAESERDLLLDKIDAANTRLHTSPIALMESVLALRRARGISMDDARALVRGFMNALQVQEVSITPEIGALALHAYQRYGKPNPAQLNMGDCFAYGCAKSLALPLLYKGNDFSKTDIG
ncbi:MAG: type II toxin-antitoxin system VapC family toxin [Desulfovibrionaceae bacterium]|nr:type II toxin-antitoxin system VapC family toxin [Desulfovibrionaceae bacterium]